MCAFSFSGHHAHRRQCALVAQSGIPRVNRRGALADVGPREDQEHDRRRDDEH
jgi:hypothetical protein